MKVLSLALASLMASCKHSSVDGIEVSAVVGYDDEGNQVFDYEDAKYFEVALGDEDETAIINGLYLCFSVYAHRIGEGVTCLADFETMPEAQAFAKELGSILGVPVSEN